MVAAKSSAAALERDPHPESCRTQHRIVRDHEPPCVPRDAVKAAFGEWIENRRCVVVRRMGEHVDHDVRPSAEQQNPQRRSHLPAERRNETCHDGAVCRAVQLVRNKQDRRWQQGRLARHCDRESLSRGKCTAAQPPPANDRKHLQHIGQRCEADRHHGGMPRDRHLSPECRDAHASPLAVCKDVHGPEFRSIRSRALAARAQRMPDDRRRTRAHAKVASICDSNPLVSGYRTPAACALATMRLSACGFSTKVSSNAMGGVWR